MKNIAQENWSLKVAPKGDGMLETEGSAGKVRVAFVTGSHMFQVYFN